MLVVFLHSRSLKLLKKQLASRQSVSSSSWTRSSRLVKNELASWQFVSSSSWTRSSRFVKKELESRQVVSSSSWSSKIGNWEIYFVTPKLKSNKVKIFFFFIYGARLNYFQLFRAWYVGLFFLLSGNVIWDGSWYGETKALWDTTSR